VIWYLLSRPGSFYPQLPSLPSFADELVHFALFFGMSFLWLRALGLRWLRVILIVGVCISFGLLTEFHQMTIPGRDLSLADIGANTLGTLLGAVAAWFFEMFWRRS